jgi:diamine N-acetyltransferase
MTSPDAHLREITDDNREADCARRVRKRQKRFVDSVARSPKGTVNLGGGGGWDDRWIGWVER